jgi:hypothetical protein
MRAPSRKRGFDSLHPLISLINEDLLSFYGQIKCVADDRDDADAVHSANLARPGGLGHALRRQGLTFRPVEDDNDLFGRALAPEDKNRQRCVGRTRQPLHGRQEMFNNFSRAHAEPEEQAVLRVSRRDRRVLEFHSR